ncbi:MAG: hypothetical protein KC417_14390, partial [Myxococcales bacterium]|nr:hypothetical protein [Myxococcales bacterium]
MFFSFRPRATPMSLATIRVVGASLLAFAAFLGCGRSRPVPSQGEDPTGAPASTTAPRTTTTKSSSLGTATVFPAGTRRITVEGAALAPA